MVNSPEHTMRQVLAFKVVTLIDEQDEITEFNELIDTFEKDENVPQLVRGLKVLIRKPARLQLFDDVRRVVPLRLQMEYNLLVPYTSNRTRNVRLLRRGPPASFGFSIRGGREHGTGFFVSAVEINSEAHQQGLRIGDQIVRINGFSVEDAIHQEVLHLIQSYNHLNLRVRSVGMIPVKDSDFSLVDDDLPAPQIPLLSRNVSEPLLRFVQSSERPSRATSRTSLPASTSSSRRSSVDSTASKPGRRVPPSLGQVGRSSSLMSFTNKKHDPLTWKMVDDKTTPPPTPSGPRPLLRKDSDMSLIEGPSTFEEGRDVKLFLDSAKHTSIGITICKGTAQRPGIFVQATREGGLAWEAGLATGDQILEVNGVNFENIGFDDAVRVLKSSKQLELLVRKGAGGELFGESSGYNSSTSSVNGDPGSPRDGGKRLSLITEDPEDGERSRSNSRRDADEAAALLVTQHINTVVVQHEQQQQQQRVQVQVHREEDTNGLARSSSGSSASSLSSALSSDKQRRTEPPDDQEDGTGVHPNRSNDLQATLCRGVVPEEQRHKHQMLMQEFQQAHRKMFSETEQQQQYSHVTQQHDTREHHVTRQHDSHVTREHQNHVVTQQVQHVEKHEERFQHVTHNGDIYAVASRGSSRSRPSPLSVAEAEAASLVLRQSEALHEPQPQPQQPQQRRSVEMHSIDHLSLNGPQANNPKPPAVYFGGGRASSRSQPPGVVVISEYPDSNRRSAPVKLEFLQQEQVQVKTEDPQSALASELQNTLSRSNLRQLAEPVQAPPPPPVAPSPPSAQISVSHNLMNGRPMSPPPAKHFHEQGELSKVPILKRTPTEPSLAYKRALAKSPPPVIALKPLAVPYTELVTQKNQQFTKPPSSSPLEGEQGGILQQPASHPTPLKQTTPVHFNVPMSPVRTEPQVRNEPTPEPPTPIIYQAPPMPPAPPTLEHSHQRLNLDSLANKVTIKFPNGESASSAGSRSLSALLASAPAASPGILKNEQL